VDTEPEEVYLLDGDRIGLSDCMEAAASRATHARGFPVGETQMVELPDYDLVLLIDPGLVCLSAGRHTRSLVVDAADVARDHFHQMFSGVHTGSIHGESLCKEGEQLKWRTGRYIRSNG